MTEQLQELRGYFISSTRTRRELIPVEGQNSVRCVTLAADEPEPTDTVLTNVVAFEDELIRLKLMKPRNAAQKLMAKAWFTELDRMAGRPKPDEPLETLFHYVK